MLSPNWSDFILCHEENLHLQQECGNIINIFDKSETRAEKLANLASIQSIPSVVILTLDPFDNSIQPSFFHQATGPTFHDTGQIKCLALTGFESTAFPIQLNVDHLQATLKTEDIHTPSLTALMSTHSEPVDSLKTLLPETTVSRHIRKAAVLPPILTDRFLQLESPDPWDILHSFIKTIHDSNTEETEDGDLTIATIYFPILTSLWAFCNHQTIQNLHTPRSPATDTPARNWSTHLHKSFLHQDRPQITDLTSNNTQTLALDRLAESLAARESRFAAANDDDITDNNDITRRWKKIDRTMREATLFASTTDGLTTPDLPTERLLQLVQAKNGAIAATSKTLASKTGHTSTNRYGIKHRKLHVCKPTR